MSSSRGMFDRAFAPRLVTARSRAGTPAGVDLVSQIRHFLTEHGETYPRPILGGFVAQAQPSGRVHVYWRLPGPPALGAIRRLGHLRRYDRLLRSWGLTTELHPEPSEPYLACWVDG